MVLCVSCRMIWTSSILIIHFIYWAWRELYKRSGENTMINDIHIRLSFRNPHKGKLKRGASLLCKFERARLRGGARLDQGGVSPPPPKRTPAHVLPLYTNGICRYVIVVYLMFCCFRICGFDPNYLKIGQEKVMTPIIPFRQQWNTL